MDQSPSFRLERRQVMAFALHQALYILQMPQLELAEWISKEMERNPLLKEREPRYPRSCSHPLPSIDPSIPAQPSLRDHLLAQARESFPSPRDLSLASILIDHLDERGWLTLPLEELPYDLSTLKQLLATIQTFHPPGVGARHLQESLLLQLRVQPYSLTEILIRDYFQDLLHGRFKGIQKQLRISSSELQQSLQQISHLRLNPASSFDHSPIRPLIPDLILKEIDRGWILEIGEEELPLFSIRSDYVDLYNKLKKGEEKETLRSWLTSARWLMRCLKRRRETLRQIGRLLVQTQRAFLEQTGQIKPIRIQDLANLLQVHPSTAWRAVANKTLACPRGLIPLRQFFAESTSTHLAKELLQSLIAGEDKTQPFTDDELVEQLREKGISCARRTIAKYRNALHISTAAQRKALGH